MMRSKLWAFAVTACALLVAIPLTAANGPAAKTGKNAKTATAMRSSWPPETLSGKITMVDPDQRLVVVETPNGVPFDMVVTANTRITSGDQAISLKDLSRDRDKTVSVRLTPERRGDVANSIVISG